MRRRIVGACVLVLGPVVAMACGSAGSVNTDTPTEECKSYLGGGDIPRPPDGASLCPEGPCNYQTQDGCSSDQTCGVAMDAKAKTVAPECRAAGTIARGEACDDSQGKSCARGLLCISKVCRKLCCGADWSACDAGESCVRQLQVQFEDTTTVDVGVDFCVPVNNCAILDPTACAEQKRTCRIVDPTGAVGCAPASTLVAGDPCDKPSQCGPGLLCVLPLDGIAAGVQGTCRKLCNWGTCGGEPSCSKDDGTCVHFTRDPEGVGECIPDWSGPPMGDGGVPGGDAG